MRSRLLAIQHEDDCPPGWFGEWIEAAGVAVEVVSGHRGDAVPDRIGGYGGLLVLGGEMGAYDDEACPWLPATRRLIARTVASGMPFLGICLGHQLASVALGGRVGRSPAGPVIGLNPVDLTPAGRSDPLLGAVEPGARAAQWNEDVVTELPPGSSVLAVGRDEATMAVGFGPLAWGVQFHPEVSPEIFSSWTGGADESARVATAAAVADARHGLQETWRPVAERFASVVTSAATGAARVAAP